VSPQRIGLLNHTIEFRHERGVQKPSRLERAEDAQARIIPPKGRPDLIPSFRRSQSTHQHEPRGGPDLFAGSRMDIIP